MNCIEQFVQGFKRDPQRFPGVSSTGLLGEKWPTMERHLVVQRMGWKITARISKDDSSKLELQYISPPSIHYSQLTGL